MSKASQDPNALAYEAYEAGVRAMQDRKFEKAKGQFEKVIASPVRQLADRAKVYLHNCDQHLAKRIAVNFESVEEHFDYAVSLMNSGDYLTAREHLEKLKKQAPQSFFVIYGLAALDSVTGHVEDALQHLSQALKGDASLRFQARNDPDFRNLSDDPRFTELVYPDPGVEYVNE